MDRVFICYSRRDSEFVDALVADLNMSGVATWYDVNDISRDKASNSQSWRRAVDRALRECTHMIVVLSPNSVASEEVEAEWNYFLKQKRPLFPIIYQDCDIPYRLDALNWIDFRYHYENAFNSLIELLPYRLSQPLTPPPIDTSYKYEPAYVDAPPTAASGWMGIPYFAWVAGSAVALILLSVLVIIINGWRNGEGGEGTPTATTEGAPTQATDATQDVGLPTDAPTSAVTETPTVTITDEPLPTDEGTIIGGGTGKLALVSGADDYQLNVVDLVSGIPIPLTNTGGTCFAPVWSPDGSRIAFLTKPETVNFGLFVINADGTNLMPLTPADFSAGAANWSADGNRLILSGQGADDSTQEIYTVNADGSSLTRLATTEVREEAPMWSPDGTRIVYYSWNDPEEIYAMNADGSGPSNLTNAPSRDIWPVWSPDGTKIAFGSDRDGSMDIFVMNADGSNPINLTNDSANDNSPAWSPDGLWIAFNSDRDENNEIYAVNVNSLEVRRLTNYGLSDLDPDWQPTLIPVEPTPSPLLSVIFDFAAYLLPSH